MKALSEIVSYLNQRFNLESYGDDRPFSELVPEVYQQDGRKANDIFDKEFFPKCNGLMLTGDSVVKKVYLVVFLCDEVVSIIGQKEVHNALIFTHHPIAMETSNRGFLPLSPQSIKALQKHNISVYSLHNPLDQYPYLSTSLTLARGLGLQSLRPFTPAGLIGHLTEKVPTEQFLHLVRKDLEMETVNVIARNHFIQTVAVLAGGGCRGRYFRQAVEEGADAFYTGTYKNLIQNSRGEKHRRELAEFLAENPPLTLIEGSHYGTEAPVIKRDIALLFEHELGLETQFIPQSDPWY